MHQFIRFITVSLLATGVAHAAGTPAGTAITNQARGTYKDASGTSQATTSNEVTSIVQQVGDVSVTPDGTPDAPGQTQQAVPAATVVFPYTLVNTGNGTDSFTVDATSFTGPVVGGKTAIAAQNITLYRDSNGNGVLDPGERTPLPTITVNSTQKPAVLNVAADEQVTVFVEYTVPAGATTDNVVTVTPSATSVFDGTKTDTNNYNRTAIVNNAVFTLGKTVSAVSPFKVASSVAAERTLTYTITATNTGSQAGDIVIADDIFANGSDLPSGSSIGTVACTPSSCTTIGTDSARAFQRKFTDVAVGQTVSITVTVVIPKDAPASPASDPATNVATAKFYAPNTNLTVNPNAPEIGSVTSNPSNFMIPKAPRALVGPRADADADGFNDTTSAAVTSYLSPEGYTIAPSGDTQGAGSVSAGTSVTFSQRLRNAGNTTDTFNLSGLVTGLPAGVTVQFLKLDGTPMADSNADGLPDSGPLAASDAVDFLVKVTFPPTTPADADGGNVRVTATSTTDGTVSEFTTNTVAKVKGPGVTFGDSNSYGTGSYSATLGTAAETAQSPINRDARPGVTVSFPMDVINLGGSDDSFNLAGTATFTLTNGSQQTVGVMYYPRSADTNGDGVLSSDEIAAATPITNSGSVPGGGDTDASGEVTVFAVVPVPANAAPGVIPVAQTAASPTSGASNSDTVPSTVTVSAVRSFTFTPDRSGTVTSPGTVIYTHQIKNTGNATITGADVTVTATMSGSTFGWGALYSFDGTTYYGTLAGAKAALSVVAGGTATLHVKVNAPAGLVFGAVNVLDITLATSDTGPLKVTDTTTVVSGKLNITKSVVNCVTDPTCAASTSGATVKPGEYLHYDLVAKNLSTETLTQFQFADTVPANTTLVAVTSTVAGAYYRVNGGTWTAISAASPNGGFTASVSATSGSVIEFLIDTDSMPGPSANDTTLAPNQSVQVGLTVRVK